MAAGGAALCAVLGLVLLASESSVEPEGAEGEEGGQEAEADFFGWPFVVAGRYQDHHCVDDEEGSVEGAYDSYGLGLAGQIL